MWIPGRIGTICFIIVFGLVFSIFFFGDKLPPGLVDPGTTQAYKDANEIFIDLNKRFNGHAENHNQPYAFIDIVSDYDLRTLSERPFLLQGYDAGSKVYVDDLLQSTLIKLSWEKDDVHAKYKVRQDHVSYYVRGVYNFGKVFEESIIEKPTID